MAAVRQDADEYTTPLIIQMARYLSSFEPDPANFYVQLFSNLKVLGIPFRIASTNYDLLIECPSQPSGALPSTPFPLSSL